jgi:hypothetical protein
MRRMEAFALRAPRSVLEAVLADEIRSEEIGESLETEDVLEVTKQARIYDKDDETTAAKSRYSNHRIHTRNYNTVDVTRRERKSKHLN